MIYQPTVKSSCILVSTRKVLAECTPPPGEHFWIFGMAKYDLDLSSNVSTFSSHNKCQKDLFIIFTVIANRNRQTNTSTSQVIIILWIVFTVIRKLWGRIREEAHQFIWYSYIIEHRIKSLLSTRKFLAKL